MHMCKLAVAGLGFRDMCLKGECMISLLKSVSYIINWKKL